MPLWNQFLIKTYDYSPQPSTLLNFTTGVFIRLFWNSGTENFGNYLEKRMQYSFLLKKNVSLLRTAYTTGLKTTWQNFLGSVKKEKDVQKLWIFLKEPSQNCP